MISLHLFSDDRETRDYAMYLDGDLIGFARTYQEAETTLDELLCKQLRHPLAMTAVIAAEHAAETEEAKR